MFENSTDTLNNSSFVNGSSNVVVVELTKEEKAILIATYSIVLLVALIGNVLIILVFSKYKPLRKSINYFVVNMAVSDLFTPLTIMLLELHRHYFQVLFFPGFSRNLQMSFANFAIFFLMFLCWSPSRASC